jgi:uncharacterized membrane protein YkvA (DUF1232 family)
VTAGTARARTRAAAAGAAGSKFFRGAQKKAAKIVEDPKKLRKIAEEAAQSGAARSGTFTAVVDDFRALIRLVVAYARGHYRETPVDQLVFIVAGLIYVVSPIDLIPDAIAGVGLMDDAAVIGAVIKSVRSELDAFRQWELGASD